MERERFLREAKTIASLRHPGIVEIHDLGEHQGRLYLALELVEGGSLRDVVKNEPQSTAWSAAMLLQLAEAVRAHPLRFAGLAAVAPQLPDKAAREDFSYFFGACPNVRFRRLRNGNPLQPGCNVAMILRWARQ